jgi:PAS domain S-box-containing protein
MSRPAADLFDPTPKPADAFEKFLTGGGVPGRRWIGYLAAIGLVALALAGRFAMQPVSGGLAFHTFYPAVIVTAMLFGVGPGVLAGALSAVCALYFFLPPYFSFDDSQAHLVPLAVFATTVALTCYLAHRFRRAASEARTSRMLIGTVLKHAAYPVFVTTMPEYVIVYVNDAWEDFLGYTREEAIGRTTVELGVIADLEARTNRIRELCERRELPPFEQKLITRSGELRTALEREVVLSIDGRQYVLVTSRDITEQRGLERALLDAGATEQQRLGHELHDGLGQQLTGISLLAAALASANRKVERSLAEGLANIAELTRQSIKDCRAIAHGLSPLEFSDRDIREALRRLLDLQRDMFGLDAHLDVNEDAALGLAPATQEHLYRIAQEAVANARRHGQARSIRVRLDVQPTTVRMDVLDDGIGLPSRPEASAGIGLKVMDFRARQIGARLAIEPARTGGTLVSIECPQPPEPQVAKMPGVAPAGLGNGPSAERRASA